MSHQFTSPTINADIANEHMNNIKHERRHFLIQLAALSTGCLLNTTSLLTEAAPQSPLQRQVAALLYRFRQQGLINSAEGTSWSVYDFTSQRKLVAINEDAPRQAASMIKPLVALAFFYTARRRGSGLRYTPEIRATMERMIRNSDNNATNKIMHLVSEHNGNRGPSAVEMVLKRDAPGIFAQTDIVEYIPPNGRTYKNRASAHDYSRFLYALWLDRLPQAAELRNLMALPNRDRITTGVSAIPAHVRVYDKTGSTAQLCGDMGIVSTQMRSGRPHVYTFVGIIERDQSGDYGSWIKSRGDAMRGVSKLVYRYMEERYQLV
ncbi:serine hydrolase [Thiospirillum jenense]|uniref:beta-lactamase n=1 Tax=Thiospirillum jenense TaxID=1653858 RepID=A0A839HJW0_9GAMM|nr:serine hydrolase [Thiospirillum jenense]MBB1126212.1 serine hydrolase [Thiospirillum jenense]